MPSISRLRVLVVALLTVLLSACAGGGEPTIPPQGTEGTTEPMPNVGDDDPRDDLETDPTRGDASPPPD